MCWEDSGPVECFVFGASWENDMKINRILRANDQLVGGLAMAQLNNPNILAEFHFSSSRRSILSTKLS